MSRNNAPQLPWGQADLGPSDDQRADDRESDEWDPPQPLWRRVLRAVSVPQLVGVVVFAAAIAIALGFVWTQSHVPAGNSAEPESASTVLDAEKTAGARLTADEFDQTREGENTASMFAHVIGEVRTPGVVELPAGSRVSDAVEAAGGPTSKAALAGVNLARAVVDGEQILVPNAAQADAAATTGADGAAVDAAAADAVAGEAASAGDAVAGAPAGTVIDLNMADAAQLETLPRIGPAIAARVIEWRSANGAFVSVDQLLDVPGIGAKTLDGFRDRVRVS